MRLRWIPIAALTVVALTSCSSSSSPAAGVPAAPEPAVAPAVSVPPAGTVISLPPHSLPEGVAADPKTGDVAVAIRMPYRMAIVDSRTMKIVHDVFTNARARHLILEKPGGPILYPAENSDELLQIALPSGKTVAATFVGMQPHNASYAKGLIYVADELNSNIDVIRAKSAKLIKTLPGPVQPGGTAVLDGIVAAVDVRGGRLYEWSQQTLAPMGSFAIGNGPTHEAEAGHGLLAINDTRGGDVILVDPRARRIVGTLRLPGEPYGIASDPATGRVWVTVTGTNQLVQLQVHGDSLSVTKRWPVVQQANTVAYEPSDGCVFVTGQAQAQLERICDVPG